MTGPGRDPTPWATTTAAALGDPLALRHRLALGHVLRGREVARFRAAHPEAWRDGRLTDPEALQAWLAVAAGGGKL